MEVRCWDKNSKKVECYKIPEDAALSWSFIERKEFYDKDVRHHKKQVDTEIVEFYKISKQNNIPKDIFKMIVDNHIKRPVKYGCHVKVLDNPQFDFCRSMLILFAILFFMCLSIIIKYTLVNKIHELVRH
jgi:hypothetical protein